MFFPVGDEPRSPGVPYVTYGLIAANSLVYLLFCLPRLGSAVDPSDPLVLQYVQAISRHVGAHPSSLMSQISAYDVFLFSHGFRPAAFSLVSLFTSMFLHSGLMHLAGNMLFLKIFGDNVELHMSRFTYLCVYLTTGAAGTLLFALFQWNSPVPLVGASGAISGILGCYFVWFPGHRVKLMMTFMWTWDVVRVPARLVLGFYLLIENVLPLLQGGHGGVAYGAHLGGFMVGAAFAWATHPMPMHGDRQVRTKHLFSFFASPPDAPQMVAAPQAAPLQALVGSQQYAAAFAVYQNLAPPQYATVREDDLLALADWLTEERRFVEALQLLHRFVAVQPTLWRAAPDGGDSQARLLALAQVHLRAGLLQQRVFGKLDVAAQHFQQVLALGPNWRLVQAARQGLAAVHQGGTPPR